MPRAVRFDHYGGVDVLQVVEIDQPHPGPGEVVVRVIAAATNPGEMMIREGAFADVWPATFPEGQGNDFSGRVAEVGPGETRFSPGDEVMGFTPRAAQADYVVSASDRLARKPPGVVWEVAAAIPAAGSTAYAAVRAVRLKAGETVVVAAAPGGVGGLPAPLARLGWGGGGPSWWGRASCPSPPRPSPRSGGCATPTTNCPPATPGARSSYGSLPASGAAHGRTPLARRTGGAPLAGLPGSATGA